MIALPERRQLLEWIGLAVTEGARLNKACGIVGLSPRTLQRWRQAVELREDGRVNRISLHPVISCPRQNARRSSPPPIARSLNS